MSKKKEYTYQEYLDTFTPNRKAQKGIDTPERRHAIELIIALMKQHHITTLDLEHREKEEV